MQSKMKRDIAKHRKAEDELHLHSVVMANMDEGVYLVRMDNVIIVYANPKFEKMFGYDPGEMIGRHASIVNDPDDKNPEETAKEILRILEETGEWHGEIRNIKKDGTPFWCVANVSVFNHPEYGKVLISIHTDITERKNAEKALQFERDNFINILDSMEDGVYIVDRNHDIQYVNPVLKKDFGPYKERKCYDYFHDRKEVCPWCKNEKVFAGKTVRWEWYSLKNQKTYDLIDTPLRNPDGSISKLEIFRDITERKKAEDELRLQSIIVTNVDAGVYLIQVDNGIIVYTNPKFEKMFGYDPGEMIGRHVSIVNDPTDKHPAETVRQIMAILKETGEWHGEIRNIKKDGTPLWCIANILTFNHPKYGNVWVSTHTDITERKKGEAALRESEDFLKATGRMAKVGGWRIDAKTREVFWTEEMYHIAEKPLEYKPLLDEAIDLYHPEDRPRLTQAIERAIRHGEPFDQEFRFITAKGNRKWVRVICHLDVVNGETVSLRGTFQDITERKKAEAQVLSSLKKKETLLREIHHRVKNNLQVISSLLSMQARTTKNKETTDLLLECKDRVNTMALIHSQLYESKSLSTINMKKFIETLAAQVHQTRQVRDKNIITKVQISNCIFPITAAIPCGLIVNELLTNSLKHAFVGREKGKIEISLRKSKKGRAVLTLSDDGVGLPDKFDIETCQTLGLRLVKILVREQLAGELRVVNKKGTTFTIELEMSEKAG